MRSSAIMTVRELANYIRLHENQRPDNTVAANYRGIRDEADFIPLAVADLHLQQKIIDSPDPDLDILIHSSKQPVPLSQLTNEALIDLHCEAGSRNKALSRLAKLAAANGLATSYEEMYLELERRENIQPSVITRGVAIPHSRFPNDRLFPKAGLIIARSACGIDFGAAGGHKVHLMFVPCAPTPYMHMRMLAQIAKMLHIPNLITRFRNTTEKRHILQIINAFEQLNVLS